MNRGQLALTIKSKIPREIATNRAVGAGAGAREIGMWQQKMRTDSSRENDSKGGGTAAVYRMADKLQGAGGSEVDDQVGGNPGQDR